MSYAARRQPRGLLARAWDVFWNADANSDGVVTGAERGRAICGRLILIGSIGLCVYTAALDIIGPMFGSIAGIFFGAIVGFIAPFFEAFGFKLRMRAFAVVCIFITIGCQLVFISQRLEADRLRLENAQSANAVLAERADAMRDTSGAQQAMADARADLERATKRRDDAEAMRVELAGLPAGVWNARIAEIQTIIGATPDGVKYNRTTDAMTAFVADAQREYEAAVARRDAAQVALDAVRATVASGSVAQVESQARAAAETWSITGTARSTLAYFNNGQPMDKAADMIAYGFFAALMLFVNFTNFSLNNHGGGGGRPRRLDDGETLDLDPRSGRLLMGPDEDGRAARFVDRTQIADDAPIQPGERPSAAAERLRRAREALQSPVRAVALDAAPGEDDLDLREAKALEAMARARRLREIEKLEAEARAVEAGEGLPERLKPPQRPSQAPAHDPALQAILDRLDRLSGSSGAPGAPNGGAQNGGATQTVHVHAPRGDALDRRTPGFVSINLAPGETLEQAMRRARREADLSALPVIINGEVMVWPDGTVLNRRDEGVVNHPRWKDFRDAMKDLAANGAL